MKRAFREKEKGLGNIFCDFGTKNGNKRQQKETAGRAPAGLFEGEKALLVYLTGKSPEKPEKSSDFLIDFKNVIWYNSKLRRCACQCEEAGDPPLPVNVTKEGAAG